ncbi:unnamed protein product [Heligmosomoides polygyrus]|uniref:BPTI/Kunitz inhibitor domain-containing protein n=1 Tax=Heligmosomoides polygyrus TaxID=6339 RepID=A0A183F796_HELPZ|nr:unnamed protein product [Heligmosomoides polygyrus]
MNRYYYDADLRVCRMYWFGGCFSSSKNDFPDQESCQWKCMGVHSAHASSKWNRKANTSDNHYKVIPCIIC